MSDMEKQETGGTVEPFVAYIGSTWKLEIQEYGYFGAVIEPDADHLIRVEVISQLDRIEDEK